MMWFIIISLAVLFLWITLLIYPRRKNRTNTNLQHIWVISTDHNDCSRKCIDCGLKQTMDKVVYKNGHGDWKWQPLKECTNK